LVHHSTFQHPSRRVVAGEAGGVALQTCDIIDEWTSRPGVGGDFAANATPDQGVARR
jgi:hypothetical protein